MLPLKRGLLVLTFSCASLNAIHPSLVAKGPLFGGFLYYLTKGIGYGVPVVVASNAATAVAVKGAGVVAGHATSIGTAAVQSATVKAAMTAPIVGFEVSAATAASMTAAAGVPGATLVMAPTAVATIPAAPVLASTVGPVAVSIGTTVNNAAIGGVAVGKAAVAAFGVQATSVATGTVVAVTNGAAGYVAAVETAAVAANWLGNLIPFLP